MRSEMRMHELGLLPVVHREETGGSGEGKVSVRVTEPFPGLGVGDTV